MISTQHALDGVTVTTSTRVEGKVRISLDHQYFDTNKVHLSPDMARKVAADLVACAASCEAFNAGAGGHVASPQRAQQGTTRQGFLIVLAGAAVTWGFLGYAFWQHLGR